MGRTGEEARTRTAATRQRKGQPRGWTRADGRPADSGRAPAAVPGVIQGQDWPSRRPSDDFDHWVMEPTTVTAPTLTPGRPRPRSHHGHGRGLCPAAAAVPTGQVPSTAAVPAGQIPSPRPRPRFPPGRSQHGPVLAGQVPVMATVPASARPRPWPSSWWLRLVVTSLRSGGPQAGFRPSWSPAPHEAHGQCRPGGPPFVAHRARGLLRRRARCGGRHHDRVRAAVAPAVGRRLVSTPSVNVKRDPGGPRSALVRSSAMPR